MTEQQEDLINAFDWAEASAQAELAVLREEFDILAAALRPFADAMKAARATTGTQTLGLLEAAAFYHLKGGAFAKATAALAAYEGRK